MDIKVLSDTREEIEIGEMVDMDDGMQLNINISGQEDGPDMRPAPMADDFSEFDEFDDDDDDDDDDDLELDLDGFSVLDTQDIE